MEGKNKSSKGTKDKSKITKGKPEEKKTKKIKNAKVSPTKKEEEPRPPSLTPSVMEIDGEPSPPPITPSVVKLETLNETKTKVSPEKSKPPPAEDKVRDLTKVEKRSSSKLMPNESEMSLATKKVNKAGGQIFVDFGRPKWPSELNFLIASLAFALDLINVWQFTFLFYYFGGVAFLFPYVIFLVSCAIPILYLEVLLGQFIEQGIISAWKLCPIFKGVGYALLLTTTFWLTFYLTSLSWALHFIFSSMTTGKLPWGTCENEWNTPNCFTQGAFNENGTSAIEPGQRTPGQEYFRGKVLQLWQSVYIDPEFIENATENGIHQYGFDTDFGLGPIVGNLSISLLVLFTIVFFVVCHEIVWLRRMNWITVPLPIIIMSMLFFRGCTLDGAGEGLAAFLTPNFSKLLDAQTWSFAAAASIYAMGCGFGGHFTLSTFNSFHHRPHWEIFIVAIGNFFNSFLTGCTIFSYLGILSYHLKVDVQNIVQFGPQLIFETISDAVSNISGGAFYSSLFYFMLICIGLDSAVIAVQTVSVGIIDEHNDWFTRHKHTKVIFKFLLCATCYIVGLTTVTRGGIYMYTFFDGYCLSPAMILLIFIEVIGFTIFWGTDNVCRAATVMTGRKPNMYLRVCWKVVTPATLLFLFFLGYFAGAPPVEYDGKPFPEITVYAGMFIGLLPFSLVPIIAIKVWIQMPGKTAYVKMILCISPENEHRAILRAKDGKRGYKSHYLDDPFSLGHRGDTPPASSSDSE